MYNACIECSGPQPREPWDSTHWPKVVGGMPRQCSTIHREQLEAARKVVLWKLKNTKTELQKRRDEGRQWTRTTMFQATPKINSETWQSKWKYFERKCFASKRELRPFPPPWPAALEYKMRLFCASEISRDHHINLGERKTEVRAHLLQNPFGSVHLAVRHQSVCWCARATCLSRFLRSTSWVF